jgi:branched-chain amino acid transport system substrate-binding protein
LSDASDPGTAVTDAQRLISDHVAAIIDINDFDVTWASAASAAKIPVVGGNFTEPPFLTNPDFYPSGATGDVSSGNALSNTAKLGGATSMGILYCVEVAVCAQQVPPLKAAGAQLGVPLTYSASIAATAPNYTAQCVAAQQGRVQALYVPSSEAVVARVAADCDRQGYDPIYVLAGTTYTPPLPTAPGVKKLWMAFQIMPVWSDVPEVQAMNTAVDKYYPGLRSGKGGIWSQYAAQAWTAGLLIRDAVKGSGVASSGTVTAAAMTQGLNSIKNDTLDGWSPPLTFTAGQSHPVHCWFTAKWANGTPSLLDNGQVTCQNGTAP